MRLTAFVFALGLALLPACDNGDDPDGTGGSLTQCDLNFSAGNDTLKDFGEGCAQDSECAFAECILPGTPGNITNAVFGFCSRGCDCENDTTAQLPDDQKEELDCLYPSGFKNFHHVVVECANTAECQALDSRWTSCESPSTGGVRKLCHAK